MSASDLRIVNIASEQQIKGLVDAFYARVREDNVLGPIFAKSVGHEWVAHLARMSDFWATVVLASRRHKGNPIAVHLALPGYARSLRPLAEYWRTTTSDLLGEAAAVVFIKKAEIMAERLLLSMGNPQQTSPA